MINEVCAYLNNYFEDMNNVAVGDFTISDGSLNLTKVVDGQYFRIVGSALNDGIYQYPCCELQDETFFGAVYPMRIPQSVLRIVDDIAKWQEDNEKTINSPFTSESFGGYSYSRASGSGGNGYTWRDAFANRLKPWRCL